MANEIITILVKAVFGIIGVIGTYYIAPIAKQWLQKTWVKTAVEAAEKIYKESGMGEKKYEYVVKFLVGFKLIKLDEKGNVPEFWKALIEAAVKELDLLDK